MVAAARHQQMMARAGSAAVCNLVFDGSRGAPSQSDVSPRRRHRLNRVALVDWDELHVDVPELDLVLPNNAASLDNETHDIAAQA
jgi:hypothetical protein